MSTMEEWVVSADAKKLWPEVGGGQEEDHGGQAGCQRPHQCPPVNFRPRPLVVSLSEKRSATHLFIHLWRAMSTGSAHATKLGTVHHTCGVAKITFHANKPRSVTVLVEHMIQIKKSRAQVCFGSGAHVLLSASTVDGVSILII
jgi:hypothetical protein